MTKPKQYIKQGISLKPGQQIPTNLLNELQTANDSFKKTQNRAQYLADLARIFQLSDIPPITTEFKLWLGGFIEGEGSLNVSCKKLRTAKFGILVDPEFSLTQHVNGFAMLYMALVVFNAGRITYKSGSNATLVLTIDNRLTLQQKVVPFFERYVVPYGSPEKVQRLADFKQVLLFFNQKAHSQLATLVNQLLPLWDKMRKQKGQSNQSFTDLQSAQDYVTNFVNNKNTP